MAIQRSPVKSLEKTIRIIETIEELDGARVTELATTLELAKSTVHDHLKTLESNDFVVKRGDSYHIGLRFLDHGGQARATRTTYEEGQPEVEKLAETTGELANLVVEEHGFGIYMKVARGENAVNDDTYEGKREYLHSTAAGKSILAHLPREQVESIIETRGLPAETDRTKTSPEDLFAELQTVKEKGYATDREENLSGLRCVAAPIVQDGGSVMGSVSVSGPARRMQDDRLEGELASEVERIANIIEVNVTYS